MKRDTLRILLTLVLGSVLAPASAQGHPERPAKIIIPYTAGGYADVMGGLYADKLSKELHQRFVIVNRPSAGGSIGTALAAASRSDGHALVVGNDATQAMRFGLCRNPVYHPINDFKPI